MINMHPVAFDSAEAIIDHLRAFKPGTPPQVRSPYQWAFRGQADARWNLIPSAMRPGTRLGFYSEGCEFKSVGNGACVHQMNAELGVLCQFAQFCDRVGLAVPGFHSIFRQSGYEIRMCGGA